MRRLEDIETLSEQISSRGCVLFIGAGFSALYGMPAWPSLLLGLIDHNLKETTKLKSRRIRVDRQRYLNAAKIALDANRFEYCASLIKQAIPKSKLARQIKETYAEKKHYPSKKFDQMQARLENICKMPCAGIITTNYDNIIDNYLSKYSDVATCINDDDTLGNILYENRSNIGFYYKMHGHFSSEIVLSTEEYDDKYLRQDKNRVFLKAAMLRYNFVFLGCSIESEILRIRRELQISFGASIPTAFNITEGSEDNIVRANWLRGYASIETILYDNTDGTHSEFDNVLAKISKKSSENYLKITGLKPGHSVKRILASSKAEKIKYIGEQNQQIIALIQNEYGNRASHNDMFSLSGDLTNLGHDISSSEVMYRVYYLISIGVLTEIEVKDSLYYSCV